MHHPTYGSRFSVTFYLWTHSWPSQPPVWPVVFCRPGLPLGPLWLVDGTAESQGWGGTPTPASTSGHKSAPSTMQQAHRKNKKSDVKSNYTNSSFETDFINHDPIIFCNAFDLLYLMFLSVFKLNKFKIDNNYSLGFFLIKWWIQDEWTFGRGN